MVEIFDAGGPSKETNESDGERKEMSPAHDWHHVQRVETLAERLLEAYDHADERVVTLAVLLHDIGRAREGRGEIDDHADWGAQEARTLLAGAVSETRIDAVCHAIRVHRCSTCPSGCTPTLAERLRAPLNINKPTIRKPK